MDNMTSGCAVCVYGFPTELPPQRVVDKLTVHFQRARNGGGEIANIRLASESPDCAVITFEEAAVAQRILKTDKQILTVAGKSYPLRVCPYTPGLNADEIFVRVYMEIDYGRIPGGKESLQNLCKQYEGIVFKFPPQKMSCLAKGSFTELQAFSSELLRCFQSRQRDSSAAQNSTPDLNFSPDKRRSAEQAGGEGSSCQGAPKAQAEKKSQEPASEGPPPIKSKENCTEPPEDFSLVMDCDVYFYMRKFCQEELSSILLQHRVGLVDASGEGIATLYLQTAAEGARALASARLAISRLSQQLEATLRKEKISRRDLGGVEGARRLLEELQSLCPKLLCRQDKEHLSLIGNMVEVSQAKQYVQGFIAARDHRKLDVPLAVSMPQMPVESPMPVPHAPSAGSLPRRGSLPRWPSGKTGCKLATRFSASDSNASLPSFSSRDTPLVGLLPGDFSPAADYRPAETRNRSLQGAQVPAPGSQVKQSLDSKAASPVTPSGGPLSSLEAWKRSKSPLPFYAPSSTLRSLDYHGALRNEDPKISDLGRPSTYLLPKPPNGRDSVDEPSPVARVNVDHLQPSYREESIHLLQQEVGQEGRGQKAALQSPPVHVVQREGGSQEGLLTRPPGHICERFSYSTLAVEGPEDEALARLCSSLKACHDSIVVSRERYHLGLSYPQEAQQRVLEALHCFCAQRLAILTEQLLSQDAQRKKIQEDTSKTEIQRRKGSTTGLLERPPRPPGSLAGENISSGAQRFPDASQPTGEQNFPSDGKARPSRKLAHAPAAGEEGCPDWRTGN